MLTKLGRRGYTVRETPNGYGSDKIETDSDSDPDIDSDTDADNSRAGHTR